MEKHAPANSRQWKYLYGTRWQKARLVFLTQYPLCRYCEEEGRTRAAAEVDHIIPHKGDAQLFWDVENWQGLCAEHHRGTKQKEEVRGERVGCDTNGNPYGQKTHWSA